VRLKSDLFLRLNQAKRIRVAMPRLIPENHQIQVFLFPASKIWIKMSSRRKTVPRYKKWRMRKAIPASIPKTQITSRMIGG
ncbi:uncharacterized protein METZ01_LOCUS360592, partial [marine metagenome]